MGRSGGARGGLERSGRGWESLVEVRKGSWDLRGVSSGVGGPSGRFGTGRGTLEEVRDGSGDPR